MSQIWKPTKDLELEFDLADYEFMKKYEDAFKKMEQSEKRIQKAGAGSDIIKEYCQLFYDLYDDIFGEGTSQKIFKGKYNVSLCDLTYESFLKCAELNAKEVRAIQSRLTNSKKDRRAKYKNNLN